jgi:chromosome condensin MukBEF MukE localization factor
MNQDKYITIISGLPRSGTSMMMKMLDAGGMDIISDGERKADEDNPRGYYEFEKVKKLKENASWLDFAQNKVVKIVFNFLYNLPADKHYKVIFMQRNLEEILTSQHKMLKRRSESSEVSDAQLSQLFEQEIMKITRWLSAQINFDVLYISYNKIIDDPVNSAQKVNEFLDNRLSEKKMVKVVDKSLYRNKSSIALTR